MDTPGENAPRLLLLVSPNSYRGEAFVSAAKRLGAEVVRGIDVPEGISELWNVPLALDFARVDAAVQSIVDFASTHPLDAIVAVDDSATVLAARAAEALDLPHNPVRAAEAARDKATMRDLFVKGGVPSPVFRRFSLMEDPSKISRIVNYPCVVKPRDQSGSRGVIRADDPVSFVAAFNRLKRMLLRDQYLPETTDILVEDFIPGDEVALEGLLTQGSLHTLALFDKPDPLDGPFFEETIYVTPSRLSPDVQRSIADCAAAAAQSIGLAEGPVHAEMRVNERGPWMLEIAGRSIGGMCSTILEFGTGMSLEEIILRHALSAPIPTFERDGHAAGAMMIPIPRGGILRCVEGVERAQSVPHITGVEISIKPHSAVVPLPEGNSYLGFIFARADDPATVEAALRAAHNELRFDIAPALPMLMG